jgi:uncharacterized membrane protein YcaP (DUF421 family)
MDEGSYLKNNKMKAEEIKLWDWSRMFVGEVPPGFLLEIVFRIAVVYLILMVSMRLLGKRMSAQLTRNELAAMVSLAAAIGVPILSPDRGLLPAMVIAIVVVAISRITSQWSAKNERVETITQGSIDTLVADSVMNVKVMTKTRISKERIMAELRSEKIKHLGEVKRLFMEANGSFTLIKEKKPKPGLVVIPESDLEFLKELKVDHVLVCHSCGKMNPRNNRELVCDNCEQQEWVGAIEE